ncbi:MAG: UvrD-helicase domain-containing protein, partial [Candidatus Omnitrophota bacterium]
MTENIRPDQKERDKISKELGKNFFVEAGAGSGKTHSMVNRMTGLVREGCAKIENIAAVTFTRKAAAELRERFQIMMEGALHDKGTKEEEKDRIAEALSSLERASISTVHSFCARLLRERPVEAGIDPDFEEIEEDINDLLAEEVWAAFIERQSIGNNPVIGWMRENGIGQDMPKGIYKTLVKYPDVKVFTSDVPRPAFGPVKKEVERFVKAFVKKMPPVPSLDDWDDLQSLIRRSLKLFSLGYLEEDRKFVGLLRLFSKTIKVTLKRWPNKDGEDRKKEAEEFRDGTVLPALQLWQEYIHKPIVEFALEGVLYYQTWRSERNVLNFQDLLMKSAKLLREFPEVRAYFKGRITHLLVDEFQDTDPIQAEIVMLLSGKDNAENDWRKVKPKEGSLFLVGDPKQSIYRFRRADIDVFNRVKEFFA